MTFRTEGEIVGAVNAARDLTNLVISYLTLYRKYAQGMRGVTIPDDPYTVVFLPMIGESTIQVKLVHTQTSSHQEPMYYDVDDDNYNESWGASNISHETTVFTESLEENIILIPFGRLLTSRENMELDIKRFAEIEKKRLHEMDRESKITAYQEAIRQLQEGSTR